MGEGNVGAQAVINRLISVEGGDDATADETSEDQVVTGRRRRKTDSSDTGIEVVGASDLWVKLAKCCTPVPGDQILGFVTRGAGVSVHRTDCVNAANLRTEHERLVEVAWAPTAKSSFLVAIQVEALDRNRLLSDITRSLSDQHVNILSAALNTTQGPDLQGQVHLRDRRPDPPRPRAAGGPAGAGGLRRLPRQPVTEAHLPASYRLSPPAPPRRRRTGPSLALVAARLVLPAGPSRPAWPSAAKGSLPPRFRELFCYAETSGQIESAGTATA